MTDGGCGYSDADGDAAEVSRVGSRPSTSGGELGDIFESLRQQFDRERATLEGREDAVKRAQASLESEKASMMKFGVSEGDVLELNVGGAILATKRSTLLLAPEGSMLHSMFSGRWDDSLCRDAHGRMFLDLSPDIFKTILGHLRTLSVAPPEQRLRPPTVRPEDEQEFEAMVEYLGLRELVCSTPAPLALVLRASGGCPSVKVAVGGRMASNGSASDGHMAVVGEHLLPPGESLWKVTVRSLKNNHWILVGIIGVENPGASSYSDDTSYGWAGHTPHLQVVIGGGNHPAYGGWIGWQAQDVAIFKLDTSRRSLTMFHRRLNQRFEIENVSAGIPWRIHANLHGAGDCVEFDTVSAAEWSLSL